MFCYQKSPFLCYCVPPHPGSPSYMNCSPKLYQQFIWDPNSLSVDQSNCNLGLWGAAVPQDTHFKTNPVLMQICIALYHANTYIYICVVLLSNAVGWEVQIYTFKNHMYCISVFFFHTEYDGLQIYLIIIYLSLIKNPISWIWLNICCVHDNAFIWTLFDAATYSFLLQFCG